jgi:hypothetical protein
MLLVVVVVSMEDCVNGSNPSFGDCDDCCGMATLYSVAVVVVVDHCDWSIGHFGMSNDDESVRPVHGRDVQFV